MNIQLMSTKAIFLQLAPLFDGSSEIFVSEIKHDNTDKFNFDLEVDFPEDKENIFLVTIKAELSEADSFILQTVFLAEFSMEGVESKEKFISSPFPYVNAPAIAYPFFRSFVANTLVNSGLKVKYLPAVNFQALYDKQNKKE